MMETKLTALDFVRCQVVSYYDQSGRRWIVGLPGDLTAAQLGKTFEILQYCYYESLERQVRYWKEILQPTEKVTS